MVIEYKQQVEDGESPTVPGQVDLNPGVAHARRQMV